MAIVKHTKISTKDDGPDDNLIKPTDWNADHTFTTAADAVVLGRASGAGPGAVQELPIAALFPVGGIIPYAGDVAPTGWYICDGSLKSTTTDAQLFIVCQFKFGGSGSQFALPDLRGRFPAGADGNLVTIPEDPTEDRITTPQVTATTVGGHGGFQKEKANVGGLIVDKDTLSGVVDHGADFVTHAPEAEAIDSSGSGGGTPFDFPNRLHTHRLNIHGTLVQINGAAKIQINQFTEEVTNVPPVLILNYIIKR